jgi:RNA-binding protein
MTLSKDQIITLKAKAHQLNPVVTIGHKGLTPAVVVELKQTIEHHELMKVRTPAMEKPERIAMSDRICGAISCETVAIVGRIVIVYKKSTKDK